MGVSTSRRGYHHGDLRESLIAAADELLVENGVEGFSLRETAQRVGVSPSAPSHHFGSVAGLLTEIAKRGFEDLYRYMLAEVGHEEEKDPLKRIRAYGAGYVRFAMDQPGRFQVMFNKDRLCLDDAALKETADRTHEPLKQAVRECLAPGAASRDIEIACVAARSLVHGFAVLALDGRFDQVAGGGREYLVRKLLPRVLSTYDPAALIADKAGSVDQVKKRRRRAR